jgi:hypothetical protein
MGLKRTATAATGEEAEGMGLAAEENQRGDRYYFDISTHGLRPARVDHGDDALLIRSLCTRLRSVSEDIERLTQQTRPAADFVDLLDANDATWRALLALDRVSAGRTSWRRDYPRTTSA